MLAELLLNNNNTQQAATSARVSTLSHTLTSFLSRKVLESRRRYANTSKHVVASRARAEHRTDVTVLLGVYEANEHGSLPGRARETRVGVTTVVT